ncbi:uncharacterized protein LOC115766356 [Drosophila novamexicana]|uniref:uncharacterized protein LOC115766356 n=1 Tax=Drosophila novamexicana TaxID=47314 RepID=UPI0011E59843|nr:uncharacterized protein LOC115766356 [Drosophila novamexicana]
MCMPYLGKLFSSGQRRRTSATGTPRPSLAPTPQQSNATIQTTNVNSVRASKKESGMPVKASHNTAAAASLKESSASTAAQAAGTAVAQAPAAAAAGPAKPTSWWEYLGMNKNKKGSINSL